MLKVAVSLHVCQGHARCEDICPEVFGTDAVEGKCVILQENVPEELAERVMLAVKNCPEGALRYTQKKGGEA